MNAKTLAVSLVALTLPVLACGKPPPKAPPPVASAKPVEPPPPVEVHEKVVPHVCAARSKLAQLLGQKKEKPMEPLDQPADSAAPPTSSVTAGSAKIPANQAYRVIAPATVLIRTDDGLGTGVIIDPKGYVLTNNHVIADGRKSDFITTVKVTLGDLAPTGRMVRQEKTYEGVVVKTDPVRDIAIVKIKDPPAKLEAAKFAKSAPQVAEKVIAVGHAGIGFLWAAKTCSVATVGERQNDSSMLAAFDCANLDPAAPPAELEQRKTRCDEAKKRMTDALSATTQGLAIQTDCSITHGDSGGPLVNVVGEVIGLNQSISVDAATVSFHVHLDELREFATKYPEEGTPIIPDPLCEGGFNPTLEDVDLDGIAETLVNRGGGKISLLIDLDQDQIKKAKDKQAESFDAEIAFLHDGDSTYVWYDTDSDGKFDVLLFDKDDDGKPEQMYRLDPNGGKPTEEKDKEKLPHHDFSSKLVKDPALHVRLAKIATAIGGSKLVSAKALERAASSTTIPDPLLGGGNQGRLLDSDSNGKSDFIAARGAFSRGVLIDADEDSIGKLKPGSTADDVLKEKKIDAEVAIAVQGNTIWAQYDTNNDGKFDLALVNNSGVDSYGLFATSAFKIGDTGALEPAPEHLGRRMLRPGLVPQYPRVTSALRYFNSDVAADEALGTLPDPFPSRGRFRAREIKGLPNATVIEADVGPASIALIDVDHDSKVPAKDPDFQKLVGDGKFDAEVAIIRRGSGDKEVDWIFYDTDGDGKMDLVLYVPAGKELPAQAFRVTKDANAKGGFALATDATAVTGKALRHKTVFKDKAMGPKFKTIAAKMFKSSAIED